MRHIAPGVWLMLVCFFLLHGALDYLITRLCFDTHCIPWAWQTLCSLTYPSWWVDASTLAKRSGSSGTGSVWIICVFCVYHLWSDGPVNATGQLIYARWQPISGAPFVIIPQAYDANGFFAMFSMIVTQHQICIRMEWCVYYSPTHRQTNRFDGTAKGLKK